MGIAPTTADVVFALDVRSLNSLRQRASESPKEAAGEVVEQFEALLLGRLLKAMRDSVPRSGLLDERRVQLLESLLDQQLAQGMAQRGIGLADKLLREIQPTLHAPRGIDAASG